MKDASILGNLRGMLVDEIHGLRYYYGMVYKMEKIIRWKQESIIKIYIPKLH